MTAPARTSSTTIGRAPRDAWLAVAGVLAFWWLATGTLFAAQRGPVERVLALAMATVAACGGAVLVARNRNVLTARGATASFAGGMLLWLWVATTLYGGWVVGVAADTPTGDGAVARTLDALRATLANDLLGIAAIALAGLLSRGGANRAGLHAIATFWVAHQVAKLNLFLGVAYPGTELLPPYLGHLARHFGPTANSPLLAPSVAAFAMWAAWLAVRARREARPWARRGGWLLATLVALAAVEHALLGAGAGAALWRAFLALRDR